MLDLKEIRKNPEEIKRKLSRRNPDLAKLIDEIVALDKEHRKELQRKEELESERNQLSKLVGMKKSKQEDAEEEITKLNSIKLSLKAIADLEPELFEKQSKILESIPNLPDDSIPDGENEEANLEVFNSGSPKEFNFQVKDHDEIGRELGIFDFERGVKISKSRFTLTAGLGARLERALINFMLDKAAANGYLEVSPPIIVNSNSLYGTGQLPKFAEDLFKIEGSDLYLIPTAEVPLTNIYNDEILELNNLPIKLCAMTPCFRSEAGSASKDTRGIIRQHQFYKIELVIICKPEESQTLHEELTNNAESILQELGLPYRKVLLCAGDIGFSAHKCYDLEVWFAGQGKYREISSCSNFHDFQARRAKIRFKRDTSSKAELVHTINGSGLAVGRTLAAILEYYQQEDGSIMIPDALKPYLTERICK
jgi:seryl-tRNA synthetase